VSEHPDTIRESCRSGRRECPARPTAAARYENGSRRLMLSVLDRIGSRLALDGQNDGSLLDLLGVKTRRRFCRPPRHRSPCPVCRPRVSRCGRPPPIGWYCAPVINCPLACNVNARAVRDLAREGSVPALQRGLDSFKPTWCAASECGSICTCTRTSARPAPAPAPRRDWEIRCAMRVPRTHPASTAAPSGSQRQV